ncbi:MAG TPA: FAD-dependent oxidoreductase [Acidimicrobiales bacterium]|nr:FAD-dependent oxidoreductase [Acidimicrobiales bacterium]
MSEQVRRQSFDAIVVGSGIAGCTTALELVARGAVRVALVTKGPLSASTTAWAQGGVAVALSVADDSVELHEQDTLRAGGGLSDLDAVRVLVAEGPVAVRALLGRGAIFDRDDHNELARAREGGHSVARVIHAGGMATGAEVIRALATAVATSGVSVLERLFVTDLVVERGRCSGVTCLDSGLRRVQLHADAVVLATGGVGMLFDVTTNPSETTGDGIALALRAGIPVADLEFVQFHPTALCVDKEPRPLLSEGLRGYGALLVDQRGERFVDELAARDVVSRAIVTRLLRDDAESVFLDARRVPDFAERFPTIASTLAEVGLDAGRDLLPVAPAAHYLCGGIVTDLAGRSAVRGLFAVGEVACTGAQGANRLASNSLLEGLVFASRAARAIVTGASDPQPEGALAGILAPEQAAIPVRFIGAGDFARQKATAPEGVAADLGEARAMLRKAMSARAGVIRDAAGLVSLAPILRRASAVSGNAEGIAAEELRNLADVGSSLAAGALAREETRGVHTRSDAPERDDAHFRVRVAVEARDDA